MEKRADEVIVFISVGVLSNDCAWPHLATRMSWSSHLVEAGLGAIGY
jgi:hypothetical protein